LFTALILQRKKSVYVGKDIRELLKRRMNMWEDGKFQSLMKEAKKCDAQFPQKFGDKEDLDVVFRTFNRLMLLGKVRQATRYLTQRCEPGGV